MGKIKRAVISVSDKTGVIDFAKALHSMGIELISTGGTAQSLKDAGLPVTLVSHYTGSPEILDGRVKTLHPKIHAGLLAVRDNKEHQEELSKLNIHLIDMVVVNLYPFYETVMKVGISQEEIIENIDIGGPTMLRAAAKNYRSVACVSNPQRYDTIIAEMQKNNGGLSLETKEQLAFEVFSHTASYDAVIAYYFSTIRKKDASIFPQNITLPLEKIQDLRYGENPHQKSALYKLTIDGRTHLTKAEQLQGKELSFNNIVDLDSAFKLVSEFTEPAAVIVKHNNPCGVAQAQSLVDAYKRAYAPDPVSAFGSIQAYNRNVDGDLAREVSSLFVEAIIAPDYSDEALDIFRKKKNLRILKYPVNTVTPILNFTFDVKRVDGGALIQDADVQLVSRENLVCVTKRQPTPDQIESLLFAWKIAKHVKSNTIVFVKDTETVGIGAGQMSRIDATKLAAQKAYKPLKNIVMASDAFFPFRDNIDEAARYGVEAIIQPGGSVRDQEVIDACNEFNIAMVVTGMRHFRH
ncbi:MAG: bifunctional phosphoribosylaminoimidazolecarboxamide formyltransferase/IMP cyclohydrolase [bacterium]|nr:bifunctional phosphoribosylaminoimidazolecarboxamide formyltransferase/IMP cyclohydrolase [bacterium]